MWIWGDDRGIGSFVKHIVQHTPMPALMDGDANQRAIRFASSERNPATRETCFFDDIAPSFLQYALYHNRQTQLHAFMIAHGQTTLFSNMLS